MIKKITLFIFCVNILGGSVIRAAVAHKHVHQTSRERQEDGIFSRRDAHHHEGNNHHTEFDHEAVIGSVKEAEEFDSLTPEESKKRLLNLAQKMDGNADGFVSRNELKTWILRSFKMLSQEETTDRFREIDENQDDRVTLAEYLQDVYGLEDDESNDILNPVSGEEEKLIQDDKEMFEKADFDNNGYLDVTEFAQFQNPEEHPEMLPIILKQTLRDKDKNHDGKIDFQEFIGESAKDQTKEWLIIEKEKFDNDFDKDHDGVLNGNEILSWAVPSNDEIASEEVDHLFSAADDNHDNRLSFDEIVEHYDIFVGSEATDYGDQLQNNHIFQDEL